MERPEFIQSLKEIRELCNDLLDQLHENHPDPNNVRQQIVYCKDKLGQVEKFQEFSKQFHERLDQLKMRTKTDCQALCEFYSSPLIALADDTVHSYILGFMDEGDLLNCEMTSIRWKQVIQSHGIWQILADERNRKERERHGVKYSGEKCRVLGKHIQEAKTLERCHGPFPSAERILRREIGLQEVFVRFYWKNTNQAIWQGLVFDDFVQNDDDEHFSAGTSFRHSPVSACFDWPELTKYQSWLLLMGKDDIWDWEEEDEEVRKRLMRIFGEWDFSITIFLGDEPLLIADGVRSVQYDDYEECYSVDFCSRSDFGAKMAIYYDTLYLELVADAS